MNDETKLTFVFTTRMQGWNAQSRLSSDTHHTFMFVSWRVRYWRILCLGTSDLGTYCPIKYVSQCRNTFYAHVSQVLSCVSVSKTKNQYCPGGNFRLQSNSIESDLFQNLFPKESEKRFESRSIQIGYKSIRFILVQCE